MNIGDRDIELAQKYNQTGEYSNSELIIGLVGAVGTDLRAVVLDLGDRLNLYRYSTYELRVSQEIINTVYNIEAASPGNEYERVMKYMDAGDEIRRRANDNAILALGAANIIRRKRPLPDVDGNSKNTPRNAYIIRSLKRPEEVDRLRRIYGDGFFLIGVYADRSMRLEYLKAKGIDASQASILIQRDEDEQDSDYGQQTRDTYHLADFFVHLGNNEGIRRHSLQRILDLTFGNPYITPLFDEYAMYLAFAASLRSADLSRQVGAVIARDSEILAAGANDCPKYGGGLYWPSRDSNTGEVRDSPRGRDYTRGSDQNAVQRSSIIDEVITALRDHITIDEERARQLLRATPVNEITEYGRVVHAEMEALLTCARNHISSRGATLYCTTFPCHNCAKHLVAAGIERVVYVEPYPKSKALELHDDALYLGYHAKSNAIKVALEPFEGIGPRRFFDLFSMSHGSGIPMIRKTPSGEALVLGRERRILRMPMLPWGYLVRETLAADAFNERIKEFSDEPRRDDGEATDSEQKGIR